MLTLQRLWLFSQRLRRDFFFNLHESKSKSNTVLDKRVTNRESNVEIKNLEPEGFETVTINTYKHGKFQKRNKRQRKIHTGVKVSIGGGVFRGGYLVLQIKVAIRLRLGRVLGTFSKGAQIATESQP